MSSPPPPPAARTALPFEAVLTPTRSLDARGLRIATIALVIAAIVPAIYVYAVGAWPVVGFLGAEVALAIWLLRRHHRAGRSLEVVRLTEERLTVLQVDRQGRARETAFAPYWVRLDLAEEAGSAPRLFLRAQGRAVRIGAFLATPELRGLAAALGAALAALRSPRFDNPQLDAAVIC
ncbi:MAG: DUF2244 domain-containing protein [Alphaproteobacteria bacterium]|nr:DUF2244 domain-containing protein [Alphaproteobacteria bacterium]